MNDSFACSNDQAVAYQAVAYLGDVMQLEVGRLTCTRNLHCHVHPAVEKNADVSYGRLRRYATSTHVDSRNSRWDFGVRGVENNRFGLRLIQQ